MNPERSRLMRVVGGVVALAVSVGAVHAAGVGPAPKAAAATPPVKADATQRAAAERLDPLSRAAFWQHEAQVDPDDALAGVRLATSLRTLQRWAEADDAAERVLVLHPNDEEALLEAARAKLGADQGFYAIQDLERAAAVAPRDWRPVSLLGVAYDQTKRPAEARAAWERALVLSPDNPAILSNIALAEAGAGRTAAAEALLRRAAGSPTASSQVRQNLALVLGLEGRFAEAETLIRHDLPPETADANLAYLHAMTRTR